MTSGSDMYCQICDKQFKHRTHFNDHMKNHSTPNPYPCEFCPQRLTTKSSLTRHLNRCPVKLAADEDARKKQKSGGKSDPKTPSKSDDGSDDVVVVEGVERPHKCGHCKKRFQTTGALYAHNCKKARVEES